MPLPLERRRIISLAALGLKFRRAGAVSARLALIGGVAVFQSCRKGPEPPPPAPPSQPREETPPPEPLPPPPPAVQAPIAIPYKRMETAKLFSGIQLKTTFTADFGGTATTERQDPSSYELDLQLRVRIPKAHQSLEELQKLNPELARVFPDLERLLSKANVSPLYEELYQRKVASVQTNLTRLDALLSRHNFFDIETILELESPITGRKALLIQSDMDVDTDGSDGDRLSSTDGVSSTFQPFTSYRWPKVTQKNNPFLPSWEKRLKDTEKELASPSLIPAKQKELQEQKATLKAQIIDLKRHSFLVGSLDPFVVLPLPMVSRKEGQPAARIGDYCVVVHGNRLFPAVIGDAGPSMKSGEASLRICRELNGKSGSATRPESDLKVTYLVFPGTADSPRTAPSLAQWWIKCDALLGQIGSYRGELVFWEDLTKPPSAPPPWDPRFIGPVPEFYGPPTPW